MLYRSSVCSAQSCSRTRRRRRRFAVVIEVVVEEVEVAVDWSACEDKSGLGVVGAAVALL